MGQAMTKAQASVLSAQGSCAYLRHLDCGFSEFQMGLRQVEGIEGEFPGLKCLRRGQCVSAKARVTLTSWSDTLCLALHPAAMSHGFLFP